MVRLERMSDYRGVGLQRVHITVHESCTVNALNCTQETHILFLVLSFLISGGERAHISRFSRLVQSHTLKYTHPQLSMWITHTQIHSSTA